MRIIFFCFALITPAFGQGLSWEEQAQVLEATPADHAQQLYDDIENRRIDNLNAAAAAAALNLLNGSLSGLSRPPPMSPGHSTLSTVLAHRPSLVPFALTKAARERRARPADCRPPLTPVARAPYPVQAVKP